MGLTVVDSVWSKVNGTSTTDLSFPSSPCLCVASLCPPLYLFKALQVILTCGQHTSSARRMGAKQEPSATVKHFTHHTQHLIGQHNFEEIWLRLMQFWYNTDRIRGKRPSLFWYAETLPICIISLLMPLHTNSKRRKMDSDRLKKKHQRKGNLWTLLQDDGREKEGGWRKWWKDELRVSPPPNTLACPLCIRSLLHTWKQFFLSFSSVCWGESRPLCFICTEGKAQFSCSLSCPLMVWYA